MVTNRKAYLRATSGVERGRRYVIRPGQRFSLGRGRDTTIHLDDSSVSRRHALVELTPEGLRVVDLGSRNGTRLNDEAVRPLEQVYVGSGDILQLGSQAFQVELVGRDEALRDDEEATRRLFVPLLEQDEFEVLGELGRGSTGIVHAARQRLLDRTVAIKVPLLEEGEDPEADARFLREARLQCQIDSPYVVGLHDVRRIAGRTFLILELVNGYSAKDRVHGGVLPIHEGLRIGKYVAQALDATHRAGVVHRDVKPGNVLITPEGTAKLSDFGIACPAARGVGDDPLPTLTPTGDGLGTFAYVAPEQAVDAKRVDPRADLYSLGVTLFHLIAGRAPYAPNDPAELLELLAAPPPSLQDARPDCPHDVAELVHHLMERDRDRRAKNAGEVALKLQERFEVHYARSRFRQLKRDQLQDTDEYPM